MTNSYRYVFAASTPDLPVSGTTVDLGIGQVGVFNGKTYQATSGVLDKSIIIAQGTPDTKFPQGVAKGNFTYKTDVIDGHLVKSWKRAIARKGQNMIVTMGFDGVDTTKTLNVPEGKSFTYWLTLSGSPVANLLGDTPESHYATWTEQFTVELPCTDECSDTCGTFVDANIVADAVIDAFNTRKIIGGQPISDYVKVTKLVDCGTPSGLPTVSYTTWTLTVIDQGGQISLGKIQSQYPTYDVKRVSRNGITSVYEVVLPTGDTPADFVNDEFPIVPSCDTCPSGCPTGYTLTDSQDVYIVSRPLSADTDLHNTAAQTTFAGVLETAYSANESEFLSYNGSTASVKLYFDEGTAVTALLSDSVILFGTNESICVQTTPEEIEWVSCTTCTAAEKNFVLTIKNDDCGANYLAQLQEMYGEDVTVLATNADTCTTQYQLAVESDNKDCDACDDVQWKFTTPAPFQGLVWTEVLGDTGYGLNCVTGVKFESIYEQRKAKECFLKQVAYEYEPLFISVSTRNPDPNDYSVLCAEDVPTTVVQNVKYPQGLGRMVADQVIASNYQFNQPWRKNAAERDAFEYELNIDLDGYYDQYILEFVTKPVDSSSVSGFGVTQIQAFELSVFFPQGTGNDYENVISAFVAANALPIVLEDIETV
jgi:hypothetical protein